MLGIFFMLLLSDFRPAFSLLKANEGYYVNDVDDRGGETYCGISRVYHPEWKGWAVIDQKERCYNESDDLADYYALDFYLTVWIEGGYENIECQSVANYVFDFANSGNIAICLVQKLLRVPVTGKMNEHTVKALNRYDETILLRRLFLCRIKFYKSRALKFNNHKFLKHWLKRSTIVKMKCPFRVRVISGVYSFTPSGRYLTIRKITKRSRGGFGLHFTEVRDPLSSEGWSVTHNMVLELCGWEIFYKSI